MNDFQFLEQRVRLGARLFEVCDVEDEWHQPEVPHDIHREPAVHPQGQMVVVTQVGLTQASLARLAVERLRLFR